MEEIIVNIIMPILTSIIGAVIGVLVQNFIFPPRKNDGLNEESRKVQNLSFIEIHAQLKEVIREREIIKEKIVERKTEKKSESKDSDIWLSIIGIFLVTMVLIYLYLKYETQIHTVLLLSSVFVISMCLSAVFVIIRRGIEFDSKFKLIVIWIIISVILIPIGLYLLDHPFYFNSIDKNEILVTMKQKGVASIFNKGADTYNFLLFQVAAVIFMVLFILHLMVGNLHIWAMINLSLNSKGRFIWRFLYKVTFPYCQSKTFFIGFSVFLLSFSLLFASGVFAKLITSANTISFK